MRFGGGPDRVDLPFDGVYRSTIVHREVCDDRRYAGTHPGDVRVVVGELGGIVG